MMKPPTEWFENYDVWLLTHEGVPKNSIVWQVDGNLYGRQPTAAQYRDRLEEILLTKLPDRDSFRRGKLDACVYYCEKTQVVPLHDLTNT